MKKKITAVLLALLTFCAVLGGCKLNLNLDSSDDSITPVKKMSQLNKDIESGFNNWFAQDEEEIDADQKDSAGKSSKSSSYTMADVDKLNNTENFAKNTLEHIFDGTINGKGKATGYHYTMISDSKGEVIPGTETKKDSHGVFTAKVRVNGVKKDGFSSFYPESWTPQQVVDAINEAYDYALGDSSNPHGSLWIGYSGDLEIDMYLNDSKKITTAYPIYEGD